MSFVNSRSSGGGILRGNDQNLDALADQRFNIGFLFGRVALTEENLNLVAILCQSSLEAGLILEPARLILGRQNDTNGKVGCRCGWCSGAAQAGEVTGLVIAGIDQSGLYIALVNGNY